MKIFGLEIKKHLVVWAVVFGVILNVLITFFLYHQGPGPEFYTCTMQRQAAEQPKLLGDGTMTGVVIDYLQPCEYNHIGWPLKAPFFDPNWGGPWYSNTVVIGGLAVNFGLWILVVILILSLFRFFIKKGQQLPTK